MSQYGEPWNADQGRAPDGSIPVFGRVVGKDGYTFCPRIVSVKASGGPVAENDPDGHYSERDQKHADRLVSCVNACAGLNPAGIHFLVSEVEKVVAVMRAALGTYHDPTNILPTLETALRAVKP